MMRMHQRLYFSSRSSEQMALLWWLFIAVLYSEGISKCNGFVVDLLPSASAAPKVQTTSRGPIVTKKTTPPKKISMVVRHAVPIDGYHEAFEIIDECSVSGIPSEELYNAVRVIDKNAFKIYPNLEEKANLWQQAHGSWKLQLATGGGKFTTFKPVPIFAFAMIDETNFGNGVGLNEDRIALSLLGPHEFLTQRRQMIINVDEVFLFSNNVTGGVPSFLANGMGLGKRAKDWDKGRPPAFTFIGASEKSLIARGGSGGIAIWTRLENDIRPAAYNQQ